MKLVFWFSVANLLYIFGGYFALLWLLSSIVKRHKSSTQTVIDKSGREPFVSIIVAAYNEEKAIAKRIENLLALDYPKNRMEIVIASDGSTDRTVELALHHIGDKGVVLDFQVNRGRSMTHNDAISHCKGEIVVFTDAKTSFDPLFLRYVVRHFADPKVGGVVGRLSYYAAGNDIALAESLYLNYEMELRNLEADLGLLTIGLTAACLAIRRQLFVPLDPSPDVDDSIGLDIVSKGYYFVYEPLAHAWDYAPTSVQGEVSARSRISSKAWAVVKRYPPIFWLTHPKVLFGAVSHRFLRWLMPVWLLLLMISSWLLQEHGLLYQLIFWSQILFYTTALITGVAHAL